MKEYLEKVSRPGQSVNPLFTYLGVVVEEITPERTVLRLPFKPHFIQGGGMIAGGIMATLADEAMAHAALCSLGPGETTATIEMNIRYLNARPSGEITATASLVKKGKRVISLQAQITDSHQQVLALSGASFMVLSKKN